MTPRHSGPQELNNSFRSPMTGILHEDSCRKPVCLRRLFVNIAHFLYK